MPTQVPIAEGLFTWPADQPRLLARRCLDCDNHMFPGRTTAPAAAAHRR